MTVTLDAPAQHPTWRVQCDRDDCHSRLYLQALTADHAANRAVMEYGWDGAAVDELTCPAVHAGVGDG